MRYECSVCGYVYDEETEGLPWGELPGDWECPVCGADTSYFNPQEQESDATPSPASPGETALAGYLGEWARSSDDLEGTFTAIQQMATTGESILEPMRTRKPSISWDEILVMGAQLAALPRNEDDLASICKSLGCLAQLAVPCVNSLTRRATGATLRDIIASDEKGRPKCEAHQ